MQRKLLSIVPTYLEDPEETGHGHATVNAAVLAAVVASAWERSTLVMQMAYTLSVLAVNDAGTKSRP